MSKETRTLKYFIQDYFSGLSVIGNKGYIRYFNTFKCADNFLNLLDKKDLNNEDNFFIVCCDEKGKEIEIEY
tara:strand:+ start:174 stop:389 length:216 start_codon:yes stop_codon:yes gene_type:complete